MARIEVKSDVTGSVWKIECKPGDPVAMDQELVILESMKMEIPVIAPKDGSVVEILVAEQEPVAEGQTVLVLEA